MRRCPPPLGELSIVVCRLRGFDNALELLGAFGPRKRGTRLVVLVKVLQEKCSQRHLRAVDALGESLLAQDAEKDLDEIDPRGMRRRVMKADLGMTLEPPLGRGVLVNVQVVEHDMQVALWKGRHDPHLRD